MSVNRTDKLAIAIDLYVTEVYIKHTPKYSWYTALQHCGYSAGYAKSRISDLWKKAEDRINAKLAKIETKKTYDIEWLKQEARDLYSECRTESDRTNAKGCIDSMFRTLGGFTDNINSQSDNSPRPENVDNPVESSETRRKRLKLG